MKQRWRKKLFLRRLVLSVQKASVERGGDGRSNFPSDPWNLKDDITVILSSVFQFHFCGPENSSFHAGTMRTYFLKYNRWPHGFLNFEDLGCMCVCLSVYISVFPGKEARGEIITSGFLGQNWISCSAGLLTPRRGAAREIFINGTPANFWISVPSQKNCNFEHMREDILSDNSWYNTKFSSLLRLKNVNSRFLNLLFKSKRHANVVSFIINEYTH
jgi:hypothetical protein